MHPLVRDLYKRCIHVGRDYPMGLEWVRNKAKEQFRANAHLSDEIELKKAIGYGRYQVNEMIRTMQLKKYRALLKGNLFNG